MIQFRDALAQRLELELLIHINEEGVRQGINPFTHGSRVHTDVMKTQALKQALDHYGFDAAFGGARRDEERSRAKERVYSFRDRNHRWDPKTSGLSCGIFIMAGCIKAKASGCFRSPTGPNWISGNTSIWRIFRLCRCTGGGASGCGADGTLIMVDDERMPLEPGETPKLEWVRFRTLGCYPLTGAIRSRATTLPEIIQEMLLTRFSERQGRLIDHDAAGSMEDKKRQGYF